MTKMNMPEPTRAMWEYMNFMELYVEPFIGFFYVVISTMIPVVMILINIIFYTARALTGG
ncbi:MAG: hypothetical protein OXF50_23710 [Caldilineaceae bacterium]|nr:hypothetical protein [Caldilineaceae bacterium]